MVPLKKISYDWRYVGYAGDGSVTFDLSDQGDATTLVLTHTVRKDFPDDVPQFKRESCLAVGGISSERDSKGTWRKSSILHKPLLHPGVSTRRWYRRGHQLEDRP